MKKFTTLKTLLVGLLACAATSVWAEVGDKTTNANIDFSNDIADGVVAGATNSITVPAGIITTDGWLALYDVTGVITIPESEYAGTRDAIHVQFKKAWGNKNSMGSGFIMKDADGNAIAEFQYARWDGNGRNSNTLGIDMAGKVGGHNGNKPIAARYTIFDITIDYAQKTITSEVECVDTDGKGTHKKDTYTTSLTNTNPLASFETYTYNVGGNQDRADIIDDILIETIEGDYNVATANYTVKFVCNGSEIKDADTRSGDVGSAISLFAGDKTNFFSDDESKRYIYESDDLGEQTIAEDGSTVITVTFREASKYNYTINSKFGETVLDFSATGSVWEDLNSFNQKYPKYQADGSTLLISSQLGSNGEPLATFTVNADNFEGTVNYTAVSPEITNLYLLSEAEYLETGLSTSNTTYNDRVSGSIIYGASGTLLTLPAGKYIFTLGVIGGDASKHPVLYTVSAGDTQIIEGTCVGNKLQLFASEEFTVNGSTPITFTSSDPSSDRGIDLIYIQKTGDVELPASVTVPVTSAGYATYCSEYDLDLTGIVAYTATQEGSQISFVGQAGNKVAAGTGLLIKKENGGDVTINVAKDGAKAVANNALIGVVASKTIDAGSFVLMASPAVGFYKTTNKFTVGAHTAYIAPLPAASVESVREFIAINGEATAIKTVETEQQNGEIYNLAGQRVNKAQKGLFIQNGKKVIIK